jgi:very-short-patch-repair endonuclease
MKKHPSNGTRERATALRREMTEAEKMIWERLRSRQTEGFRFRRQVPLGRFIADFVCHEAKLIVEVDGGQHDSSSEQEARRTCFLESQGYRVLRFWNNEVLENPDGVQTVVAQDLRRCHPHPDPPPSRGRDEVLR